MSYTDDRDEIAELFGYAPKKKDGYSEEIAEAGATEAKTGPGPETKPAPAKPAPPAQAPAQKEAATPPAKQATLPANQPPSSAVAAETGSPPPLSERPPESSAAPVKKQASTETAVPSDKAPFPPPADQIEVRKPVKLRPPGGGEPHPLESAPPKRKPKPTPEPEPETEVKDEEFFVYEEIELPDFSDVDFVSFDDEPEPAPSPPKRKEEPAVAPPKAESPPPAKEPAAPVSREAAPPPRAESPSPSADPAATDKAPAPQPEARKESPKPPPRSEAPPASPGISPAAVAASPSVTEVKEPSPPKEENPGEPAKPADPAPIRDPSPGPTGEKLLQTQGLVKIYDGRTVVNGVDINVAPGEIVGLLGPNGAGKTTSFYMIVGLVPPNGGQVIFDGSDVTKMPMYQRARLGMGYLPQEESIFRKLTVAENIMAVMETLPIPRSEKVERCNALLERFSITHIRNNIALTCSGGEKRRLTIARSLVTRPSLLMLDEPFSGVDPIAVNEIQNIVEDLRKSGLAILITDHNARQTLELVDRAYLIYEGKVLREGSRDFLINDPVSRELYLGDRFTM